MSRPIWKGHISFGLVNVPVVLNAAERKAEVRFHLLDSRNTARVRYERVNEETGEEVPWDKIVKGYEYDGDSYVLMSEEEIQNASPELTKTIEIEQFVDVNDIDIRYFERPYLLVPDKKAEKGYVLLREAIAESGKAGIAKVVIRGRQYLAAVIAQGNSLVLELLRFSQELIPISEFELPSANLREYGVSNKEIELASKLISGMTAKWHPEKFHDEYRDALMKLVERKIKTGKTEVIEEVEEEAPRRQTINFMDVLKRSVAHAEKGRTKSTRSAKSKVASRTRRPRKKRAG
ncbi:MAG TPA: Ku protein [Lacipirellulaceae bacterium]|nr:Ku protein [Lacipirellulaceae bacterium]